MHYPVCIAREFATIADVVQYRRLAALLLGTWVGASILVDIAVTQNFRTIDRFLQAPGDVTTSKQLNQIGRDRVRPILRRNAGEENNWIFENWERAELAIGGALFFILLFGERPQKLMMALCLAMLAIVVTQHFLLSPMIVELGRRIAGLGPDDPANARFWQLHSYYSGSEILKLVLGLGFALRLVFRRRRDENHFAREYQSSVASGDAPGRNR
jgi:hypothetical protein